MHGCCYVCNKKYFLFIYLLIYFLDETLNTLLVVTKYAEGHDLSSQYIIKFYTDCRGNLIKYATLLVQD
jgi:hypothetical protein